MTALEYMEKQVHKHQLNYIKEYSRKAPDEVLNNIRLKIDYYESAAEALKIIGERKDNGSIHCD